VTGDPRPDPYGSSTVKRQRRTNDELAALDDAIVTAVQAEHPVTLRGVFYRVMSAGAIEKTELSYRTVGRRLLALRRSGRVPYSWITDGTRWITKPESWVDLDEMLDDASASYRRALWHQQDAEVHFFTEKDAISGVVLPVTSRWDVPLGVLRGYASESFAYSVADSILAVRKPVYVYQLGDHDPSGIDAWRDFQAKVRGFLAERTASGVGRHFAIFERIAVTEAQIGEYGLPTRPTKSTDTRARGFAGGSVEVDAIPPSVLRRLVEEAITGHVDSEQLRLTRVAEESERTVLYAMKGRAL
jgi:hypothetical protein